MPKRHAIFAVLFVAACGGSNSTAPTPEPSSITLSSTTVSFSSLLATQDLTATVRDARGASISGLTPTWSTDAGSVATVSTAGRVTAVGKGTARIIAAVGALRDTATVTVQQVAATLTLSPDTLRLAAVGDTAIIGAIVRDAGGSAMTGVAKTFATGNPSIATVVTTGRVTAVATGATTVTAQVAPGGSGLTKSVRIEVGGSLPPAYMVGGYVGTAYTDQVGPVIGGGGGYMFVVTAGTLPNNLSLSSSTGQITGVPSASGAFFFQVTASNGVLTLSERYGITISTKAASAFNLWLTYNGGVMPSPNAQAAVSAALARFEQVVTGEVGNVTYPASGLNPTGPGSCQLVDASLMNGAFVDDVAILMSIGPIDGASGTLAQGGFCGYGRNPAPPATITGQMKLDQIDQSTASVTYLQDVIWHELAHAFGIGTLWQGSTIFAATDSVRYVGTNGKAEWQTLGGPSMGGPNDVPLEPTIAAHWNEGWFNGEIMTPITEGFSVRLPISRLTIGALIDLGWGAALTAGDAYTLPVCQPTCTIREPAGAPGEGGRIPDFVIERLLPLPPGAVGRN